MTRRNKLLKFTENLTFPNVYESFSYDSEALLGKDGDEVVMKGKWQSHHFKNSNPITLELACGRGEYCLGLARKYPERNFLGVDIKGARLWKGASIAINENLDNIAFIRTKIEFLDKFISDNEIDDIWITFPDPFLKESKYNRRLTSPNFVKVYKNLMKSTGSIHLKTDSSPLYQHTLGVIEEYNYDLLAKNEDIYKGELPHPDLDILTFYERMHLKANKTIKYIEFR